MMEAFNLDFGMMGAPAGLWLSLTWGLAVLPYAGTPVPRAPPQSGVRCRGGEGRGGSERPHRRESTHLLRLLPPCLPLCRSLYSPACAPRAQTVSRLLAPLLGAPDAPACPCSHAVTHGAQYVGKCANRASRIAGAASSGTCWCSLTAWHSAVQASAPTGDCKQLRLLNHLPSAGHQLGAACRAPRASGTQRRRAT